MPKGRGPTFGDNEVSTMLDAIEATLPIGTNECDSVESYHLSYFPDKNQLKDTLKRKFALLYAMKVPTGDPTCPPLVRRAKFIYNKIKEKADLVAEIDEDSLSNEEEEEETEYDAAEETADDETTIEPIQQVQVSTTTTNLEIPMTLNVTMGTSSGDTRKRKDNFSVPMQRIGSKSRKTTKKRRRQQHGTVHQVLNGPMTTRS